MLLAAVGAGASFGVTAHAVAALPKITITGTVGTSVDYENGYTDSIAYDTSAWFGKAFTLELTPDAAGVVRVSQAIPDVPGGYTNIWEPISAGYSLTIQGGPAFSGTDNQYSWLETANDITVPTGVTGLPPGMIADGTHTYDMYAIGAGSIQLACFSGGSNGMCDGESADIYEGASIVFDHFWDTAQYDAISDANPPDLLNAAPNFAEGFGSVGFEIWHWSQDAGGSGVARLQLDVSSITVTPVPEPEAYAMLLAGLGLVGFAARRRTRTAV
jgi:hypothetical protein